MPTFSKNKLEEVAKNSLYTSFTNSATILHSFSIFEKYLGRGSILELGPAEGLMTEHLLGLDQNLHVIEGSERFATELKKRFPSIHVIHSLFEEAEINQTFDNIVLGHVLEHVHDPVFLLNKIRNWLAPNGKVLCAVPNAKSLHRQVAVEMGLIHSVFQMSEKDVHHGHMRIYTPETLQGDFLKAGYQILSRGGYWLKPLSDAQLETVCTPEMLQGFMKLGEFYPDSAAEIYVIAQ